MAYYILTQSGDTERVSQDDWKKWCGRADLLQLMIARHHIIDTKELGALAVSAPDGKRFKDKIKILATVETRLIINTERDDQAPWETVCIEGDRREWMGGAWDRSAAEGVHQSAVNQITRRKGGRVFIR